MDCNPSKKLIPFLFFNPYYYMSINKNSIIFNNSQDFDDDDFDTTDKNNHFTTTVHFHLRKDGKKSSTIISGLGFENKENLNTFLKTIKKKFGINGCYKEDKKSEIMQEVFIFSGDCREKVKQFLIDNMNIEEENVKMHG